MPGIETTVRACAPALTLFALIATSVAAAQPALSPSDQAVLAAPVQAKVGEAAPPPETRPGDPTLRDDLYTSDPELAAIIRRFLSARPGRASIFNVMWYGVPGGSEGLDKLSETDPKGVGERLIHTAWADDFGLYLNDVTWPRSVDSIPLGMATVSLVTADGRSFDFDPRGISPYPAGGGTRTNGDDVSNGWGMEALSYELQGPNILIHSAYLLDGGQIVNGPDITLPAAGGSRTAALPGGGTLTLTLEANPYLTPQQIVAWTK